MTAPSNARAPLSQGAIFRFFAPLAATWLMMAAEGPFIAAIIARLDDPVSNLAAYGVAMAIGFITEAPIIMMLSASTALVRDRTSFRRLRNFSAVMNAGVTLFIGAVLLPPVFDALSVGILALPERVAALAHAAVLALAPWPAAIGFRRFYHGILIGAGRTRLVAYGTGVRLATMSATGAALFAVGGIPGAVVGGLSLSAGVIAEAAAARIWARREIAKLVATAPAEGSSPPTYREIAVFYAPLAVTPFINLAAHPLITFFLGRGHMALESLAVMPVLNAFGFVFRCPALAFQEVVIALGRGGPESLASLRFFAVRLAAVTSLAMSIVVLTPLAGLWFEDVSGLTPGLLALAAPAALVLVPTPALSTAVCFLHARFVMLRRTRLITAGTAIEVGAIAALLALGIGFSPFPGAFVAVVAALAGRLASASFLLVARWRGAQKLAEGGQPNERS